MSGNRALIYPLSWEQYPFLTVCRDNIWLLFKHLSVKIKPTLFLVTLLRFLEMPEMSFQTCKLEPKPSPVMWAQTNPFVLFLFIDMHLCLPRSFSLKKNRLFPQWTTSKPSRQAAQSPEALEKNANETVEQRTHSGFFFLFLLFFVRGGCIINSKERPLWPRGMFHSVL